MATLKAEEGSGFDGALQDHWRQFVEAVTARDVLETRALVLLQETDSINHALSVLASNRITSAPVVSSEGILGIVDVLDILQFAMAVMGDEKFFPTGMIEGKFSQAFEEPVKNILETSAKNKWQQLSSNASLSQVIAVLSDPEVPRVAIQDKDDPLVYNGVITQSELLNFLWAHKDKMGYRLTAKVRDYFPESSSVIAIPFNAFVFEAFDKIHRSKVRGLAVVDENNKLVGNISASDIKHAGLKEYEMRIPTLLKSLREPLDKFLKLQGGINPICVTPDETFETLMRHLAVKRHSSQFASTHIHRVFVVDQERRPLRAITTGDVISQFRF